MRLQADRLLAFRDSNADLHLASVAAPAPVKVAASCQAFAWNADADILAAVCDTALLVWYHPAACLAHRDLVEATRESRSVSLGDGVAVESFCGAALAVRRGDGARRIVSVNPYARRVYELAAAGKCALTAARAVRRGRGGAACTSCATVTMRVG